MKLINLLFLIFSKVNGYLEETNKSKYITLVQKKKKKKEEKKAELWSKNRNLIRSITKKLRWLWWKIYMKIKFNSDDKLPLNKVIENPSITIVLRAIFLENN